MDKSRILFYRIIPRIKQDQTKFDFCFESKVDQEQKWTLKCDQHTHTWLRNWMLVKKAKASSIIII